MQNLNILFGQMWKFLLTEPVFFFFLMVLFVLKREICLLAVDKHCRHKNYGCHIESWWKTWYDLKDKEDWRGSCSTLFFFFFFMRMLFFRPRLNIHIFLPILGWKHSCIILQAIENVFRVCIAWYKHERGWGNSRQLWKPETKSRVCITVENSPNPSRAYIRLCKHRKKVFYSFYKITSSKNYNAGKDKNSFYR